MVVTYSVEIAKAAMLSVSKKANPTVATRQICLFAEFLPFIKKILLLFFRLITERKTVYHNFYGIVLVGKKMHFFGKIKPPARAL
jgi:hypothetical protein